MPIPYRVGYKESGKQSRQQAGQQIQAQHQRAAISVLSDSQSSYKIAVLGDMLELGPFSPALHAEVGEYLGQAGIQCLVAVGEQSAAMAQGARDVGVPQVLYCHDKGEAMERLPMLLRGDCTILVKASRGMKMEDITAFLVKQTPEN